MKKIAVLVIALLSLCSCKDNFEDYNYYGFFYPAFYYSGFENEEDLEIKIKCTFLNPEEGDEGVMAIRQLDENGEMMADTGNTAVYFKNKDGIELLTPTKLPLKTNNGKIISITVTDITINNDYLFVKARKISDKNDSRYYDVDNMIWLNFDKAEMNEWKSFTKKYGR